jgi:hypothetical protein
VPPGCSFLGHPGDCFTSALVEVRSGRQRSSPRVDSLGRVSDSIVCIVPSLPGPGPVHLSTRSGTSRGSVRKSPVDAGAGFGRAIR